MTAKQKAASLERWPDCYLCHRPFQDGDVIEYDHIIPLALGGTNDPKNVRPAHEACHDLKTKTDVKAIAKAKRLERTRKGERRAKRKIPSRPFPKKGRKS